MSNACLQVSNVNFSYPKREALRALSLELAVGEVSVLLGPNGAGKSTLFGLLTGLHALQSGEIRFQGVSVVKNRAALLDKLGVVFQQSTLDLDLSVEQNLRYHAALRGMGRKQAQQRINVELERFGLLDRTKETVRSLNGGHRRRVEIARALLHEPTVLLLDEPTVGLDTHTRQRLSETVRKRCADSGVAVLWATHLMDEVEPTDQIYLLNRGYLEFSGRLPELLQKTESSSLVAAFNKVTQAEGVHS